MSMWQRRDVLKAGGAAAAAAAWPFHVWSAGPSGRPPNILFINCDQLSALVLRDGGDGVRMPNVRRLMAAGTSFELSYTTQPVCQPARSSWFTGRMPCEHGVLGNTFPLLREGPHYAQLLKAAGYEPYHVGKWHIPIHRPWTTGFSMAGGNNALGEVSDVTVAMTCRSLLLTMPADRPFFLHVGFMNPHDICYPGFRSAFEGEFPHPHLEDDLPALPGNFHADPSESETMREHVRHGRISRNTLAWGELEWRYHRWLYYRYCEMLDANLGHLLDSLEASGHAANTLVMFTSDHGEGHAEHRLAQKSFLYEEAVRVPFIVALPDHIPAGRVDTQTLVSGLDVLPTLCDYAGVEPPPGLPGISLRPVLAAGSSLDQRDCVVAEAWPVPPDRGWMVRSRRFKYICYGTDKTDQLFDLTADPHETRNLAAEPAYATTVAAHRDMLADFQSRLDILPTPAEGWVAWKRRWVNEHPDAKL